VIERVRDPDEATLGSEIASVAGRPEAIGRSMKAAIRSPLLVFTSWPTMIRSPGDSAAAIRVASSAPSITSWSVIARWVRPRLAAARTTAAGEASESNDADV
jgi:hypothetical protein